MALHAGAKPILTLIGEGKREAPTQKTGGPVNSDADHGGPETRGVPPRAHEPATPHDHSERRHGKWAKEPRPGPRRSRP